MDTVVLLPRPSANHRQGIIERQGAEPTPLSTPQCTPGAWRAKPGTPLPRTGLTSWISIFISFQQPFCRMQVEYVGTRLEG